MSFECLARLRAAVSAIEHQRDHRRQHQEHLRRNHYEPQELAASKVLARLAKRVAPTSVKRQLAERERREQAWRDQQAAKLAEQRAKLAAGEAVPCACCFEPIASPEDESEKHGSLVHTGDCEEQWGSAYDNDDPDEEPGR